MEEIKDEKLVLGVYQNEKTGCLRLSCDAADETIPLVYMLLEKEKHVWVENMDSIMLFKR